MVRTLYLVLIVTMMTMIQGCSIYEKAQYKAIPFRGFTVYPKPTRVQVEVKPDCYNTVVLDNKKVSNKIGDCVSYNTTKKLIVKIRLLETINDNYVKDIDAYNNIYKE